MKIRMNPIAISVKMLKIIFCFFVYYTLRRRICATFIQNIQTSLNIGITLFNNIVNYLLTPLYYVLLKH